MDRDEIIEAIRSAAQKSKEDFLSITQFRKYTDIPQSIVLKHFDRWSEACEAAGVEMAPSGRAAFDHFRQRRISEEECIKDIQRVAMILGKDVVTIAQYREHGKYALTTIRNRFGKWRDAIEACNLKLSDKTPVPISVEDFAQSFLSTVREIKSLPTVRGLARRSGYAVNTISGKYGGYDEFKSRVIKWIFENESQLEEPTRQILFDESSRLKNTKKQTKKEQNATKEKPIRPHHYGAMLGFRGITYEPTYEQEVVALFVTVAKELGYEILCIREEFPDCHARKLVDGRRKRFEDCLIEFELRSSDYKKHKHPIDGCELIVCWEHDWADSPIPVLELKKEIKKMDGWN